MSLGHDAEEKVKYRGYDYIIDVAAVDKLHDSVIILPNAIEDLD
jgi:hypothetical protein